MKIASLRNLHAKYTVESLTGLLLEPQQTRVLVHGTEQGSFVTVDFRNDTGPGITWNVVSSPVAPGPDQEIGRSSVLLTPLSTGLIPVDASRGFYSPVSGKDPTESFHLATRSYVSGNLVAFSGNFSGHTGSTGIHFREADISHASLKNLTAGDPHTQYIVTSPSDSIRNTIEDNNDVINLLLQLGAGQSKSSTSDYLRCYHSDVAEIMARIDPVGVISGAGGLDAGGNKGKNFAAASAAGEAVIWQQHTGASGFLLTKIAGLSGSFTGHTGRYATTGQVGHARFHSGDFVLDQTGFVKVNALGRVMDLYTEAFYQTDFFTTAGWTNYGVGGAAYQTESQFSAQDREHCGIYRFDGSNGADGDYAGAYLGGTSTFILGEGWVLEFWIQLRNGSTGAWIRAGWHDATTSTEPTDGVYFEIDEATSSNFRCVTASNTSRTKTSTGTAFTTNTWYKMRIELTASAALFYINDTLVHTETSTLPTATNRDTAINFYAERGSEDYWSLDVDCVLCYNSSITR